MAMRETVRSLKLYFILSALLSGTLNLRALLRAQLGVGTVIPLIGVAFAVAYLYVGVRLKELLSTAPSRITTLLLAGAVFLVLLLVLELLFGMRPGAMAIIGPLITWYLYVNVRRLAAESQPAGAAQVG